MTITNDLSNLAGIANTINNVGSNGQILTSNGSAVRWAAPATVGATGAGTDTAFFVGGRTVNTSYTVPAGSGALSIGPITVANGAAITVNANTRWVVL